MFEEKIRTSSREDMIDITDIVRKALKASGIEAGLCHVSTPHTTAGVTINENADPDVPRDILMGLQKLVPLSWPFRHREGNADAHIKSSLVGSFTIVPIEAGELVLGTWQGIFFCEFDGPRSRKVNIQFLAS